MDSQLQEVYLFAKAAHGDQERKFTREPYINHCIRVMNICKNYTDDFTILASALLHDVLEDTPVTEQELRGFLVDKFGQAKGERTTDLVVDLTDVYTKAAYPAQNRTTRKGNEVLRMSEIAPDAQTVKYADIIDNSVDITQNDKDFARVYLRECNRILDAIPDGNATLYERARTTVTECMA